MINVLVVDDDKLARIGLINTLPWIRHNMKVIGEASNGAKALEIVSSQKVDLAFVDLEMPGMFGLELIKRIKKMSPTTQCVILTMHQEFSFIQDALRLGTLDYVIKTELGMDSFDIVLQRIKSRLDEYNKDLTQTLIVEDNDEFSYEIRKCIAKAVDMINNEKGAHLTAMEVAQRVNMSRSYFSTCFKQIMGKSFNDYFRTYRLELAKELLLNTKKSIAWVAAESGFSNEKYFSSVFKSYTGKNPSKFRLG